MSSHLLEDIERQLAELDAEALSFDHECADRCKASLARTADLAARLCLQIKAKPSRPIPRPAGWRADHNLMAPRAAAEARAATPRTITSECEIIVIGGWKITT